MKILYLHLMFLICFIWSYGKLNAQTQQIQITGKVVESNNKQPVEFTTVTIRNTETEELISGTTTNTEGAFTVFSDDPNIYISISFIGFVSKRIHNFKIVNNQVDLGTIIFLEDTETLEEVEVIGEKSKTEFQLDKRVFNVGSDLSSTGASALEVLNNVPSVRVNIEGQISLRGSQGVQILIDGKPSAIANEQGNALGTITADMIEKIEVITNPSAKYNAEGTSGILNIILKKEDKKGLNGSMTLNTGSPNNHSFGLSLNKRTEKFNLFSQLGGGYRTFPWKEETQNQDISSNESIPSKGGGDFNEHFVNAILGTDYHLNKRNIITLSGQFAFEGETKTSDVLFSFLDTDQVLEHSYTRNEQVTADNPKFRYELQYKKDFERNKDQILLFSATGDFFAKDEKNEYTHTTNNSSLPQQKTKNDYKLAEYIFKLDYTYPFLEKYTLEVGSQYSVNGVSNDYAISEFLDEDWVVSPDLTNIFDYNLNVLAFYATNAYQSEKWGLKVGLRLENTDLKTKLQTTNEQHSRNYTNLFPSVHTSYKFTETFSLQGGYSKRILRPSLWDLNPYYDIGSNGVATKFGTHLLRPLFLN
ncbi:TonB-dependent receptor [Chondrinema litorale]|uniref:TonB-dependent receptor n=1 Tax=Chondrinema litorale TaxID=2994555 RepID=UPI002542A4F6|nr:TonB-dependent receptor [Chondrinema litorale]UZR98514.1 TonB-dependent receptor [Chondrinema litorale]